MADQSNFSRKSLFYLIAVVILLVAGFMVRMIDLTDPPLDFHATRQLREAVIARRIYLQLNPSADPDNVAFATDPALYDYVTRREPPITEGIVALIYLVIGKEVLWVSRIVTSLFWSVGGLGIYLLVKRLVSKDAALISLAVYLFLPFGVIASRSFQPEALMVAGMVWSLVCFIRWLDERTIKNAILAGVVTGLTILVKPNPLFMLLPVYLLLLISQGLLKALKNIQVWLIAGLSVVFSLVYYLFVNPNAGGFLTNFWHTLVTVVPTSQYFLGWGSIITDIIPFAILIMALASTLLYPRPMQWVPFGLWVGYVLLGIFVPYHIYTHNYYSVVLVPITAIALGQLGGIIAKAAGEKKLLIKTGLVLIGVLAIGYSSWNVYKDLTAKDYRGEPAGWALVGQAVPEDQKVIALTHNYGYNLAYYGYRMVGLWPYAGELDTANKVNGVTYQNFETYYDAVESTYDLFLVTSFSDLNSQPQLMEALSQLPVYTEGDGFIIYDLHGSGD